MSKDKNSNGASQPESVLSTVVGHTVKTKPTFYASAVGFHYNHLMGEILTLIDASIVDPTQRKAIKDVIKDRFYNNGFSLVGDEEVNIFDRTNSMSEIFNTGSRPVDDIDLN